MTTTDSWIEANEEGSVYVHESLRWLLCRLNGPYGVGWFLFGPIPVAGHERVDPGDNSPALNLLLASRAADELIIGG